MMIKVCTRIVSLLSFLFSSRFAALKSSILSLLFNRAIFSIEKIARLVTNGSTAAHSLLDVLRLNLPRSLAKEEET